MKTIKESLEESKELKTNYYTIADMKVTLMDYPVNAYKTMVNMAMKTWGNESDKWNSLSEDERFEVVKMILNKKVLPLAAEHPTFSFSVDRISRAGFDQLARTRVGIVFASKGQKDDYLDDLGFIIPTRLIGTRFEVIIKRSVEVSKEIYSCMSKDGIPNWARRCVLPMYCEHSFIFSANFNCLQQMLAKRLETTEMEDVVAFSLLVRNAIAEQYPLLSYWLRPSCDFTKKDMTAVYNGFSDIVSVPHSSDNRQNGYDKQKYPPTWDEPCTDIVNVCKLLGVKMPEKEFKQIESFDDLELVDQKRFLED